MVLGGQLSNPSPPPLRRAIDAYHRLKLPSRRPGHTRHRATKRAIRLNPTQLNSLLDRYRAGATHDDLAVEFKINRDTAMEHVKRAGLRPRWRILTFDDVNRAAALYRAGMSLATVGSHLGVDADTVRRALQRAGEPIRPRRGWNY